MYLGNSLSSRQLLLDNLQVVCSEVAQRLDSVHSGSLLLDSSNNRLHLVHPALDNSPAVSVNNSLAALANSSPVASANSSPVASANSSLVALVSNSQVGRVCLANHQVGRPLVKPDFRLLESQAQAGLQPTHSAPLAHRQARRDQLPDLGVAPLVHHLHSSSHLLVQALLGHLARLPKVVARSLAQYLKHRPRQHSASQLPVRVSLDKARLAASRVRALALLDSLPLLPLQVHSDSSSSPLLRLAQHSANPRRLHLLSLSSHRLQLRWADSVNHRLQLVRLGSPRPQQASLDRLGSQQEQVSLASQHRVLALSLDKHRLALLRPPLASQRRLALHSVKCQQVQLVPLDRPAPLPHQCRWALLTSHRLPRNPLPRVFSGNLLLPPWASLQPQRSSRRSLCPTLDNQ